MGYVYEDEENEVTTEEPQKVKNKKTKHKKNSNGKFIVDNLMSSPEEEKKENTKVSEGYTVNNLLDSEEEKEVYLDDILNKKDMKLFNAYLGKNAKKITDKNFNFAAFFFGGPYLIYRKVYGIGLFVLILSVGVEIFFPIAEIKWYITAIFEILLSLACGIFANQIIMNNVASKILNLKMKKEENIKVKLAHMGGTNILLFFVAILIVSGISSVLTYDTGKKILEKLKQEEVFVKYDGRIIANESINIRTLLDIEVPANYKTGHADVYEYSFIYTKDANIAIDIASPLQYKSARDLIKDVLEYEGMNESEIKELKLSNTTWEVLNTSISFYAAGVINNRLYFVRQMHRGNEEAFVDTENFLESIKAN